MKEKIFIICLILTLSSCITYSSKNRGSLSDAMDAADDNNEESRHVPNNEQDDDWYIYDNHNNHNDNDYYDTEINIDSFGPTNSYFIFRAGQTILSGPYFDNVNSCEILIGGDGDIFSMYLYGGLDFLNTNSNHNIYTKIDYNPIQLYGGLELRYYIFKDFKVFSPYLLGRLGGMLLVWDYKNPIISGRDTIRTDWLSGINADIGLGIDIVHTDKFRVGITCMPQSNLYGDQTIEGFRNDYFSVNSDITISLEAGFLF